jgi:hypothetical protein
MCVCVCVQPAARSAVPRTYMYTCKFKVYIYVLYVDASIDLKYLRQESRTPAKQRVGVAPKDAARCCHRMR